MILRRLFRLIFKSIYGALFFAAAVLSGLLYYFGPLIGTEDWRPLDTMGQRLFWVGMIFLFFFVIMGLIFFIRRRREKKMTEEIVEQVETSDDIAAAEVQELRGKLKTAMTALRKSKDGRRHLNELPWYVMIGPPGAGKTTAIVNSGLQFPLAEDIGKTAIGGVGGTRNCDWWFTNNAVLIDTAGRYTTQESDAAVDNAAWLGFLGMLKKYRKRQPINGAMVAISLSDLLLQDEQTRAEHAKAVRRRLNELREKLGVRFPVYVLFTKADLIAGFLEFYDNLGKEDREQVWGFTFPLDSKVSETGPVVHFDEEFAGLLERLNAQSLERMQMETDPQRRSLIAGFPSQVASMRRVARDFLKETFQDNRYEQRHLLRGVYFTSGTQEGTPIDRLMMGMARTFGIGRQAIGTGTGKGRSFFLTRLFEEVIFTEAGLVSADDKAERIYKVTKWGAIAATLLVALGIGGLLTRSYLGNTELISEARTLTDEYQELAQALPPSPIGDTDLVPVVDALNVLRDMPTNPVLDDPDPEGRLTYGLYQGELIGNAAGQTYRAALNQRFLPRLLLRLEEQITGNINNPDILYEALKVYLMLGLEGPMNDDLVIEWMNLDWAVSFPGPSRDPFREDLNTHLEALLSQPMQKIELNGPLVDQVQTILSEMPLAQRVYNGIIASNAAASLPPWRLTDVGGPAVGRVLVRSSGKALTDGIEGIYTYRGFNEVFLGEAIGVATRIARDSWVLGPKGEAQQSELALAKLSSDVLDLYYNDYISRYDTILGDIDIVPMESISHAVEVTNVLSGPTSPIVNILDAVAEETRLTEDRSALGNSDVAEGLGTVAGLEIQNNLNLQTRILLEALSKSAQATGGPPPDPPGTYVERRFEWLQKLTARVDGAPSQLDDLILGLTEVYQELNKISFSGVTAQGEGVSALVRFQEAAGRVEGPLKRWASQITTGSSGIAAGGTRQTMDARWKASVLPFCTQVTENRYPFENRARAEVAIADFTKLFGPGGLIDTFYQENMANTVNNQTRPWTWKTVNGADLGISQQVLEQFQYAAEIKEAFFSGGGGMAIQFQLTPEALDPKAQEVLLEVGSQEVKFAHGQLPKPLGVTWPDAVGLARVSFQPGSNNAESVLSRDGPWSLFRLLEAAEVRRTNVSDRKRVVFNVGGRIAIFQLQSGSVLNPFSLPALQKFQCPASF